GAPSFTKEAFPAANLSGNISEARLYVDRNDAPVVVLAHGGPSYDVTLYKRTGSATWSAEVVPGFSPNNISEPVVAFDSANKPHVLFWDSAQLRYANKP